MCYIRPPESIMEDLEIAALEKQIMQIERMNRVSEQTLVVFTNNGQTYHFRGVDNFKPTTTGFSFDYTGKATGVKRQATFNNTSVAGYAIAEEVVE